MAEGLRTVTGLATLSTNRENKGRMDQTSMQHLRHTMRMPSGEEMHFLSCAVVLGNSLHLSYVFPSPYQRAEPLAFRDNARKRSPWLR
eukprot:6183098-Pleurochrysis_carterae.AAC.1